MKNSDRGAQITILADALAQNVDTATISSSTKTSTTIEYLEQRLEHNGDVAAQALVAAATFGLLPASSLR